MENFQMFAGDSKDSVLCTRFCVHPCEQTASQGLVWVPDKKGHQGCAGRGRPASPLRSQDLNEDHYLEISQGCPQAPGFLAASPQLLLEAGEHLLKWREMTISREARDSGWERTKPAVMLSAIRGCF